MNKARFGVGTTSIILTVLLVGFISPNIFNFDDFVQTDSAKFGGVFTVTHADANGKIISQEKVHNLVTNEAMECMGDLIFNGTSSCVGETTFSYLGVGTSNTSPVNGDTALNAESATCARVGDASVAVNTGTTGQRTYTVSSVFSGATCQGEAYVETGLFDRSSGGNMLATAIFTSVTLSSGDTLTVSYDIVINNT